MVGFAFAQGLPTVRDTLETPNNGRQGCGINAAVVFEFAKGVPTVGEALLSVTYSHT